MLELTCSFRSNSLRISRWSGFVDALLLVSFAMRSEILYRSTALFLGFSMILVNIRFGCFEGGRE